jgi:hypothetical protein
MILASTAELGNVVDLVGLQLNASIFVVWVYTTFRDHSKDSATLTKYHGQVSKCIHFEFLLLLHGFHKAACFCFDSATATVLYSSVLAMYGEMIILTKLTKSVS